MPPIAPSMTKEEMHTVMVQVFEECQQLRQAGQKEYAHDDDNAFRNFDDLAVELDMDRKKVLWVYATKHLHGIIAYLNGHQSQRESIFGRINDTIVYLCLLRGMIKVEESLKEVARPA